jgi:hypothetical protein
MRNGRIAPVIDVAPFIASGDAAVVLGKRLGAAAAAEVARTFRRVGRVAAMVFTSL